MSTSPEIHPDAGPDALDRAVGSTPLARRLFLKASVVAGAFALTATAAGAVTTKKTTKKTTKITTKITTKATTANTAAETVTAKAGASFDTAYELLVTFTFGPTDGGFRVKNPYTAVFIEDEQGSLVRTIELSIESTGRGMRYIHELKHWYRSANGGDTEIQTVSSATRIPGTYKVTWDGNDQLAVPVSQGNYYVCIEASREHGPYELIRELVSIQDKAFTKKLADSGELTGASVELRRRS